MLSFVFPPTPDPGAPPSPDPMPDPTPDPDAPTPKPEPEPASFVVPEDPNTPDDDLDEPPIEDPEIHRGRRLKNHRLDGELEPECPKAQAFYRRPSTVSLR